MRFETLPIAARVPIVCFLLTALLLLSALTALGAGSTQQNWQDVIAILLGYGDLNSTTADIVLRIRLPRIILAALAGAALSLGGLVFQALLRNPLAEPYILGISGGSAVGAIIGILLGLGHFPYLVLLSFAGSLVTLLLVLVIASGRAAMKRDSIILAGVMLNAFCGAVIMFFLSVTQDARLHGVLFWLMGDLSMSSLWQNALLAVFLAPCFTLILLLARPLNLLLLGEEMAANMGVNVRFVFLLLLCTASLMVSATVSHTGLLGFIGLVIPHLLRLLLGPDHRVLVPACLFSGGAYLIGCDLLARTLPAQGEMPVGVITALIGVPLFIFLLQRTRR